MRVALRYRHSLGLAGESVREEDSRLLVSCYGIFLGQIRTLAPEGQSAIQEI